MGSALLVPSATHPTIVQARLWPQGQPQGPRPSARPCPPLASRWALPSWTQTHQATLMPFSYSAL